MIYIGGEKMTQNKIRYSLKELRARKNITQKEMAKVLDVSTQTYNAWENDLSNVKISKVYEIAEHFGLTIDDIKWQN
jgi:DNA-binding XRE family transcriptional regulator